MYFVISAFHKNNPNILHIMNTKMRIFNGTADNKLFRHILVPPIDIDQLWILNI
jgi:hypothetical protein